MSPVSSHGQPLPYLLRSCLLQCLLLARCNMHRTSSGREQERRTLLGAHVPAPQHGVVSTVAPPTLTQPCCSYSQACASPSLELRAPSRRGRGSPAGRRWEPRAALEGKHVSTAPQSAQQRIQTGSVAGTCQDPVLPLRFQPRVGLVAPPSSCLLCTPAPQLCGPRSLHPHLKSLGPEPVSHSFLSQSSQFLALPAPEPSRSMLQL